MNTMLRNGYLSLIYGFLYLPIVVLVIFSFNSAHYSMLWHQFSWESYVALFQDSDLGVVAWHSLCLGISSATMGAFLGWMAAVSFFRYRFYGKKFYYLTLFLLIVLPDILLAIAFLILFHALHFPLGFFSLFFAHTTFILPFAFVTIYTQLNQLNRNLLDAAHDLGANEWQLYLKVLLPLVMSSILVSWLLGFTMSFDDIMISYFVSGPSFQILPLQMYGMVRLGHSGELNALSSLLLLMTIVLTLIGHCIWKKRR